MEPHPTLILPNQTEKSVLSKVLPTGSTSLLHGYWEPTKIISGVFSSLVSEPHPKLSPGGFICMTPNHYIQGASWRCRGEEQVATWQLEGVRTWQKWSLDFLIPSIPYWVCSHICHFHVILKLHFSDINSKTWWKF